jgi:hypothetical protein
MSIRFAQYRSIVSGNRWLRTVFCLTLCVASSVAQDSPHAVSVSARRSYVTSSKLFYQPETSNPDLELKGLTGYGLDLRYPISSADLSLSLSVDYVSAVSERSRVLNLEGTPRRYTVREGIDFIPIELSVLAYIPVGLSPFRLSMSGGFGTYLAKHLLTVDGVDAEALLSNGAYGIHIDLGFEYQFWERVSARANVRFRDPDITVESHFTDRFSPAQFRSRVNVNGMAVSLGVMVRLFE